ncbi:MAG: hypothetical protein F6J97_12620 [Leptolyngbya sp. SIO4C1]|nr:hypothetical protein [Leptolyngbya sp. SIO4C1]
MSKASILKPEQSYIYRSYFEMPYKPEDILAEIGYRLTRKRLALPKSTQLLESLQMLQTKLEQRLTYVSLTSEAARRETLIAPVLMEVAEIAQAQLRIEYPLNVNNFLKGTLDYFLYRESQVIVIEAKNADLARGFTQLAAELIALDQWSDSQQPILLGAVTTGDVWQFGQLHRIEKLVLQDTQRYVLPNDLESLMRIFLLALEKA